MIFVVFMERLLVLSMGRSVDPYCPGSKRDV
jgi:hypothetical protein